MLDGEYPTDIPIGPRRPTLRDVARESGLSVTQTSRALNGHADVADETRRRARAAAQRIGYSPNLEARRLKKPETPSHSIGLVLATASQRFSDPFFGDLLTALVDQAAAHRYELQLSAPLADEDPVASYERMIRAKRVDGFVVLRTAKDDARVRHLSRRSIPFVTFGQPDGVEVRRTVSDSDDCMHPAVDHLVALGHRKIGCVGEPLEYAVAAGRYRSFLAALKANGIEAEPSYVAIDGHREAAGFDATRRLLDLDDPPTALVTFNDLLAIGALRAAASRGLDVPSQLSVVGFDDIHAARFTSPPLTTLRHSAGEIGRHLVQELLRAMAEPHGVSAVRVTPELVVRGSTAPPAD